MRYERIVEIGKDSGFLLGQQSADYFNFICGDCGQKIIRVTIADVDSVGFWLEAKCKECKKEWRLKVTARWGESMKPHIKRRFNEISEHLGGL